MKINAFLFQPPQIKTFHSIEDKVILIPRVPFQQPISYLHLKNQGRLLSNNKDRVQTLFHNIFPNKNHSKNLIISQQGNQIQCDKMIKSISTVNTLNSLKTLKGNSKNKINQNDSSQNLLTQTAITYSRHASFYQIKNSTNKNKRFSNKLEQSNGFILNKRLSPEVIYSDHALNSFQTHQSQLFKINPKDFIPCLFFKGESNKILVFFHANAQDLLSCYSFVQNIRNQTDYSILVMEYRGYSIYKGQSEAQDIQKDGKRVLQYLLERDFLKQNIIFCGRSIGAAIALACLQRVKIHSLILLSPFLSLNRLVGQLSRASCLGHLVDDCYNNYQNIRNIKCPTLIIHGMKDNLIPYHHSLDLIGQCKGFSKLKLVQNMTHCKFHMKLDFLNHVKNFHQDMKNIGKNKNSQNS